MSSTAPPTKKSQTLLRLREAFRLGGLAPREVLTRTWRKIGENEILTRAAAVSYYAMVAIVPFLGLLLTMVVLLLPDPTGTSGKSTGVGNMTVGKLQDTLRSAFPKEAYGLLSDQIAAQIKQIQDKPPIALLSVGLLITLWTASSLFLAVIDAMNRVYGVEESRSFVKLRLVAIVMTLIQAAILLGALVAIVAGPEILGWLGFRGHSVVIGTLLQWAAVLVMILLSFSLTFYIGPDADQDWEWITPGSLIGTLAFIAATLGLRLYVQNFGSYDKTYGSLGGVMVLLLWFWVSSTVVLSAGQMNKIIEDASPLGKGFGQKVDPTVPPDFESIPPQPSTAT